MHTELTNHEFTFSNDSWAENKENNASIKCLCFGLSTYGRKDVEEEHDLLLQLQETSTGLDIFHQLAGKDKMLSVLHSGYAPIKVPHICFN